MRPPAPGKYRRALLERIPRVHLRPALRMILRNIDRRPLRAALTTGGIAAAVAIVIMGNFFRDAIDAIVDTQFNLQMRGDVIVWMTDPVEASAARELARLPGVLQVESGRRLAVRFSHGHRSEKGLVDGHAQVARLQRIVDVDQRLALAPADGLLMTDRLAEKLGVKPGDLVTVEVREGRREVLQIPLQATVRDMMGLNAFIRRDTLNRLLQEGDLANFFSLRVAPGQLPKLLEATQELPKVAGAFSKATMLRNMQEISARNVRIMSTILTAFAAVISVGVVYNNARIALAERGWELASLRVLGFTRAECFDVIDACMSWTRAMSLVDSLFKTRNYRSAMIVNAEFNMTSGGPLFPANFALEDASQLEYVLPSYTIGEVATATLLMPDEPENFRFTFHSRPEWAELCTIPSAGFEGFCAPEEKIGALGVGRFTAWGALLHEQKECFEAGMDDFASKPFTSDSIREVLARWLSGPRSSAPSTLL